MHAIERCPIERGVLPVTVWAGYGPPIEEGPERTGVKRHGSRLPAEHAARFRTVKSVREMPGRSAVIAAVAPVQRATRRLRAQVKLGKVNSMAHVRRADAVTVIAIHAEPMH